MEHDEGKHRTTGIVLAAGLSRRMGAANKLLMPVRGEPMVRHAVRAVRASRCRHVIVVLGHQAFEVRHALQGLDVEFVFNEDFEEGMGASLRMGVAAAHSAEAVLVCLGDMPFVSAAAIDSLLDAYDPEQGMHVCQAAYHGRRGHPVLWGKKYLSALQHSRGDVGARALLAEASAELALVEVDCAGVLQDIDDIETLAASNNGPVASP